MIASGCSDLRALQDADLVLKSLERPTELAEPAFVAVPVRRLANASTVWINARWFRRQGVEIGVEQIRKRVESWLTLRFGFGVCDETTQTSAFAAESSVFHAERYGATGLSPNGGGGRAGIALGYCVKGIGRTPLVGRGADWQHANGHLLLEEALREAMWAELIERARPGAAVPTVAVLDFGAHADPADPTTRRALSIRPFALRLAHFQRATYFKPIRRMADAQPKDGARTLQAVRMYANSDSEPMRRLGNAFVSLAGHVAHGHVHRLFHGGLYSANATTTGTLLDFGSTRQVPDWSARSFTANGVRFGDEMRQMRAILQSLLFFFGKYAGTNDLDRHGRLIWRAALKAYAQEVGHELSVASGLQPDSPASLRRQFMRHARSVYRCQQRHAAIPESPAVLRPYVASAMVRLCGTTTSREDMQNALRACIDDAANTRFPVALMEALIASGIPSARETLRA